MMHGLRKSMAKGAGKKEIHSQDDSHNITLNVLKQWKSCLSQLHDALTANEVSWTTVFSSYGTIQTVTDVIYSHRDVDARACTQALQDGRSLVENPPQSDANSYTAIQKVAVAKQEINTMLSRIANAEALHTKRFEATREWKYYDIKTRQMLDAESKRKAPPNARDVERRSRNQKKVMDLAVNLNSITAQLYSELEFIDQERLSVTDRCLAAILELQKFYYEANPVQNAIHKADEFRLGRRVVPRDEIRSWMPQTLQPADPNAHSDAHLQLNHIPQTPQQEQPGQPYPAYPPDQQPPIQHVPSAPTAAVPQGQTLQPPQVDQTSFLPPHYDLPPSAHAVSNGVTGTTGSSEGHLTPPPQPPHQSLPGQMMAPAPPQVGPPQPPIPTGQMGVPPVPHNGPMPPPASIAMSQPMQMNQMNPAMVGQMPGQIHYMQTAPAQGVPTPPPPPPAPLPQQ